MGSLRANPGRSGDLMSRPQPAVRGNQTQLADGRGLGLPLGSAVAERVLELREVESVLRANLI